MVLAITNAGAIHLPAGVSGNNTKDELDQETRNNDGKKLKLDLSSLLKWNSMAANLGILKTHRLAMSVTYN